MSKNKISFIIHCPSNSLSNGGAETLHQFAFHLKKNKFNVNVIYFPNENVNLPDNLLKYNIPITSFKDDYYNINIIPEVETSRTKIISKGKSVIYWLSVDGYFRRSLDAPFWKNWNYYRKTMRNRVFLFNLKKHAHLANSHYAQLFLKKKKIDSVEIKGYISSFFDGKYDISTKKNIILYNPAKDRIHIKKLKDLFSNYKFVPLENIIKLKLKDLYSTSKIFLDFGTHPGRERMPREAAIMGCVLLLARRGSVSNNIDVPIDEIYKININKINDLERLNYLIEDIFKNFDKHLSKFKDYRNLISFNKENEIFNNKVINFANKTIEKMKF